MIHTSYNLLNIDLSKFNEFYNINVVSSNFFENFLQAFISKSKDYINVNYKSEEDIIFAIRKILDDDLIKMGRISRNLAENEFQNEIIFNKIEEIYK